MRGAIIPVLVLGLLAGCDKQDESVAKQAGDKVGQVVTEFASGVGQGVDKSMEVTVELSEALTGRGVEMTMSKSLGMDPTRKGISVYLISSQPLKTSLMAKALNKEGQEIGRSVVDVEFGADDAQYVAFPFDAKMDTQLVERYHIDIKEGARLTNQTSGGDTDGSAASQPAENSD